VLGAAELVGLGGVEQSSSGAVGRIVPLLVGSATPTEVAEVLSRLWDEDTLIVVSSDLSHFLRYEVSISNEWGPQICMQKGPRFETVGNDSARPGGAGQVCAAGVRAVA
jgi:Memo-like protein